MTKHEHPGPHLDADQLNAFAEGVLPEHERHEALAHLAECTDCRQIAFLAQEPLPVPATEPVAEPFWRRWFGPLVLTGAAAVVATLIVVSLDPHRPSPLPIHNEATNLTPAPQLPPASSNVASVPPPPKRASEVPPQLPRKKLPAAVPATSEPTPSASLAPLPQVEDSGSNADKAAPVAGLSTRGSIRGYVAAPPVMSSGAGLARPVPAPPPPAPDARRYKQPLSPTDSTALSDSSGTATATVAKNSPAPAFGAPTASLKLRIQPNQAPADAFSAINGSVTDPTGATIPGATITLRQLPGSATTQTATNAAGQFTIPTLPAGKYEMQITSPGFQPLSRQIELQPHDLAQLDSKLSIGASSETVTVEAARGQIATQSAEISDLIADHEVALPGKRKAVITVASGTIVLAFDGAGKLYLRTGGRHWKTVHPSWPGKVSQLSLTPTAKPSASSTSIAAPLPPFAPPPPVFRLTTDSGSVWVSSDGEHWRPH